MYMKKYVGAFCKHYKARNTKGEEANIFISFAYNKFKITLMLVDITSNYENFKTILPRFYVWHKCYFDHCGRQTYL